MPSNVVTSGFVYQGAVEQSWTVPPGVFSATFRLWGAQGGGPQRGWNSPPQAGGLGAYVTATIPVTPGDVYYINVGGAGSGTQAWTNQPVSITVSGSPGGYNGGAAAGACRVAHNTDVYYGVGSGGGATDIRHGGDAASNRILVAGGGGGNGGLSANSIPSPNPNTLQNWPGLPYPPFQAQFFSENGGFNNPNQPQKYTSQSYDTTGSTNTTPGYGYGGNGSPPGSFSSPAPGVSVTGGTCYPGGDGAEGYETATGSVVAGGRGGAPTAGGAGGPKQVGSGATLSGGSAGDTSGNGGVGGGVITLPGTSPMGAGAGGGGGWTGGGGAGGSAFFAGAGAGGGGGSSFVASTITATQVFVSVSPIGPQGNQHGLVWISYVQPPNAPTVSITSPQAAAGEYDATQPLTIAFNYSDVVVGMFYTGASVRYSSNGGSTWTTLANAVVYPNATYTFAPGVLTSGNTYLIEVEVTDNPAAGPISSSAPPATSPWSASVSAQMITIPGVATITAPTSGAELNNATCTLTWTIPSGTQNSYEALVVDANGSILIDTGVVAVATKTITLSLPWNGSNQPAFIKVRYTTTTSGGIFSTYAQIPVTLVLSPPGTPVVTLTADDDDGSIAMAITNVNTPNATTSTDIFRTDITNSGDEIRIATGTLRTFFIDYTPGTGITYGYRVVSYSATGAWRQVS